MNAELEMLLKKCEAEEEELQFKHFNNEDALSVGLRIVEKAKESKLSIAIDIRVNGYQLFRYGFSGTNKHNDMWIQRKVNTVNMVNKSSLHVGYILKKQGEKIGDNWYLNPYDYAFLGGGFPITIRGTGTIGSICVSGSPHEEDHQIIVDTLRNYLKEVE